MKSGYVPESGDLIWLTFDPQAGHEQAGRRPALVLSPANYNKRSSLALVCPITNQAKGYPFEVALSAAAGITGVILSDQVKSVDWQTRRASRISRCPESVVDDVRARRTPLLG